MSGEPNKPDGETDASGQATPVDDREAVRNQGETTPDAYPEPAAGEQVKKR